MIVNIIFYYFSINYNLLKYIGDFLSIHFIHLLNYGLNFISLI